jgi:Dual specificity phosphatase, catalytic domain
MDRPLPNSYWVIPGRLLAGEYPGGTDFTDSRARLARVHDAGIDYFVDLTVEGELPAYRHLLPFRIKYLRCAIADQSVPNDGAELQKLLADIRTALTAGRSIYVHCQAGIGRTGLVMGCYLAEEGGDGNAAINHLNELWLQSGRSKIWPRVPQTAEQADYIRNWPNFGKRTARG